jgi:hypothetical protein
MNRAKFQRALGLPLFFERRWEESRHDNSFTEPKGLRE